MKVFSGPFKNERKILALGAESAGNFSFFDGKEVYLSDDFGDLLDEESFDKFQKAVLDFIAEKGKPEVVLTDLHPLLRTTEWGKELAERFSAKFVQVQHHHAHIFSAVADYLFQICHSELESESISKKSGFRIGVRNDIDDFIGIACDGTGYGLDKRIWGGEVFKFRDCKAKRIGKLEDQTMIGGELAIKEPARMLISILGKFLPKEKVYKYVKKFYDRNQFELLWNQWQEGFNCMKTSSTGRVLDAVSVLLGFSGNERPYKHAPIDLLEKNSNKPYEIEPIVSRGVILGTERTPESKDRKMNMDSGQARMTDNDIFELQTTELFKYLVKNIDKDKKRLAATAQMYLARGLWDIISSFCHPEGSKDFKIFFAGGMSDNKIMSEYLSSKGVISSKEIPRGDAGISLGQLMYYLSGLSSQL